MCVAEPFWLDTEVRGAGIVHSISVLRVMHLVHYLPVYPREVPLAYFLHRVEIITDSISAS